METDLAKVLMRLRDELSTGVLLTRDGQTVSVADYLEPLLDAAHSLDNCAHNWDDFIAPLTNYLVTLDEFDVQEDRTALQAVIDCIERIRAQARVANVDIGLLKTELQLAKASLTLIFPSVDEAPCHVRASLRRIDELLGLV